MLVPALCLALAALTVVSLLLSMVRISLALLSPIAVRRLAERTTGRAAEHFLRYHQNPLRVQLPLQIANQASLVTIGVITTALFYARGLPWPLPGALGATWGVLLVFNHLVPRLVAHTNPERVASALLPPMAALSSILGPLGDLVTWLVVGRGSALVEKDDEERKEELEALIETGKDAGLLGQEDARIVESLVDFRDTVLKEVMTPRGDMVCVRADTPLHELADTFVREGFTRMPVYQDRLDNIEGFVHVKDVLAALRSGRADSQARSLAKPMTFEPETKRVAQVLREFQGSKRQLGVCIDEFGSVSGLVTIEDLLEELVGEIHDEYDEVTADAVRDDRGNLVVSGKAPLELLTRELGLEVPESDFETVSGLVLSALGRIPQKGEHLDYGGYRFEVLEADRRRIQRLRISPGLPPAGTAATG